MCGGPERNNYPSRALCPEGGGLLKTRHHVLSPAHFRQREQEGDGRFRSLVLVHPVNMQSIAASATLRRVELQAKIVPSDEPVESALRLLVPPEIRGGAI